MDRLTVPSRARDTLAIRVSATERRIMEAAAAQRPEYLTRWIREVAMDAARRELAVNGGASDR